MKISFSSIEDLEAKVAELKAIGTLPQALEAAGIPFKDTDVKGEITLTITDEFVNLVCKRRDALSVLGVEF
jgi:hypothetical protein